MWSARARKCGSDFLSTGQWLLLNPKLSVQIRPAISTDISRILDIYQLGLDTGIASFETQAPDAEKWDTKFMKTGRLVLEDEGLVQGWTALTKVSSRYVYRGVAELTIYLHPDAQGRGWALELLKELIRLSEEAGIWTLHAAIFPQNKASIALHEKAGFRPIGIREKVAYREGKWHDNLLMEKRSKTVGLERPAPTSPI